MSINFTKKINYLVLVSFGGNLAYILRNFNEKIFHDN